MSEFTAKIKAILDTTEAEKQINNLGKNKKVYLYAFCALAKVRRFRNIGSWLDTYSEVLTEEWKRTKREKSRL